MKRYSTEREDTPELQEWAELVLPYLPPPSLAAAASVCLCLRRVSLSIAAARASDASRSLETLSPIPFLNPLPHPRYSHPYSYFIYTPVPLLPPPPRSQPWGTKYHHHHRDPPPPGPFLPLQSFLSATSVSDSRCLCADDCSTEADLCPCSIGDAAECGAGCGCGPGCANRRTQRGVGARLRVVRSAKKGWGLHAAETLKMGQFVCEYAGEFLTTVEARRRQRIYDELASSGKLSPALLVVREHLPSGTACLRVNIDATMAGNVARFINHSCDGGNLSSVLVRSSGSLLPRLCFFAAKDISEGEELTFSYGEARLRPNGLPCFCGSDVCVGLLPSEET